MQFESSLVSLSWCFMISFGHLPNTRHTGRKEGVRQKSVILHIICRQRLSEVLKMIWGIVFTVFTHMLPVVLWSRLERRPPKNWNIGERFPADFRLQYGCCYHCVHTALCRQVLVVPAYLLNSWLFKIISGELGAALSRGLVPASKVCCPHR
jgi:hypothetical protein